MKPRKASIKRSTKETSVQVSINLDGTGKTSIKTGINFLDHLIVSFGKHSMMDLKVDAKSNDGIQHHLIEDTAITIGQTIDKALSSRSGITRFSYASVPMDESLAEASIDLVKRPFQVADLKIDKEGIEDMPAEDIYHFIQSFSTSLQANIHVIVEYGNNDHHKVEAAIKAMALSMREAMSPDSRRDGTPSSKGMM